MKLELKENMYVRTKDGIIDKILKLNKSYVKGVSQKDELYAYDIDNIVKASFNIIDILEVGDYVNGHEVEEVNNNLNEHKGTCNSLDTYLWAVNDSDEFKEIVIFENDIKSIVTKEQFENVEYRIGDE